MHTLMPPVPAAPADNGRRWVLRLVAGWTLLSMLISGLALSAPGRKSWLETGIVELELATSAAAFDARLSQDWRQNLPSDSSTLCGWGVPAAPRGLEFPRLRCQLLVDSLGFAPGYAGLLILCTIALYRRRRPQGGLYLHLLCVAAVITFLFDIAENGMTMRAAEDSVAQLLADGTVSDVRTASLIKWHCAALALALLGGLAGWAGKAADAQPAERRLLRCACLTVLAAALSFVVGAQRWHAVLGLGLAFAAAGFVLLMAWLQRR